MATQTRLPVIDADAHVIETALWSGWTGQRVASILPVSTVCFEVKTATGNSSQR